MAKPSKEEIKAFLAGFDRGGYAPSFSSEAEALRHWLTSRSKGGPEVDARKAQVMIEAARAADGKQAP